MLTPSSLTHIKVVVFEEADLLLTVSLHCWVAIGICMHASQGQRARSGMLNLAGPNLFLLAMCLA